MGLNACQRRGEEIVCGSGCLGGGSFWGSGIRGSGHLRGGSFLGSSIRGSG